MHTQAPPPTLLREEGRVVGSVAAHRFQGHRFGLVHGRLGRPGGGEGRLDRVPRVGRWTGLCIVVILVVMVIFTVMVIILVMVINHGQGHSGHCQRFIHSHVHKK